MKTGTSRGTINVTPLIDILLVLLIIFMVITPTQPVGLEAAVPQPASGAPPTPAPASTIVVEIDRDRNLTINTVPVVPGMLADRLREIFQSRNTRLVSVKADSDLEFQHVARTIDIIKGAGI